MNRVDYLSGHRWARQICLSAADELDLPGGTERVLCTLRIGTQQKPESYAAGVREIIAIVEDAQIVQALGSKS